MTLSLSPDQSRAFDRIAAFIADPRQRGYRVLHGLAGTGKSTVLAEIARQNPSAILTALTGKAAHVLSQRVAVDVRTLHSVLYYFRGLRDDEYDPDIKHPSFEAKGSKIDRLILLD